MICPIPAATRGHAHRAPVAMPAGASRSCSACSSSRAPWRRLALDELPRLQDRVTDQADVLSEPRSTTIERRSTRSRTRTASSCSSLFIDSTGDEDVTSIRRRARPGQRRSAANDALLLVAVEDRSDALWVGDALDDVTDDEIDAILGDTWNRNWPTATSRRGRRGAEALGRGVHGLRSVPTVPPAGETAPPVDERRRPTPAGGGFNLTPSSRLLLLGRRQRARRAWRCSSGAGGRRRQRARPRRSSARTPTARCSPSTRRSRTPTNEVEFAAAQCGEDEVTAYRAARSPTPPASCGPRSRSGSGSTTRSPRPRRSRSGCSRRSSRAPSSASKLLDEQEQRFDQLRDLEQAAPAQLQALPVHSSRRSGPGARPRPRRTHGSRRPTRHRPSRSVSGNVAEARKAISSARSRGRTRHAASSRPSVPRRSSPSAGRRKGSPGATRLLDAIERLAARASTTPRPGCPPSSTRRRRTWRQPGPVSPITGLCRRSRRA